MKQSGIDWIGEIPDDWKISKAKTILRNKSIKNHPDAEVLSLYRDLGIVPKNSRDDNHNVTSDDTASYKFVQKGELVLNKKKTWQGSLAVSDYEGIVSPAYYVCEFTNQEIDKKYIHYLLRNKMYAQEFERLSTGLRVGQWDLNIDDFLNTPIVYPPTKATQQRIAEYLDKKVSEIDSIIEESKKSIEEYKAWKQSVIFEAVTGKNLNCKKKDSGIEWIGEIPEKYIKT
ncbi:MAG: restriction endonuclease subunit S, partial [Treponema sp.]|nr:restriction endonuclease subunit S [Treponema sp.]